jgi:hypothetical protein
MALSLDAVREALLPDEPDYLVIADALGVAAVPFLRTLAGGADPNLAARAVSLAAFLPADAASTVVSTAAAHPQPAVRVASAASLRALGATSSALSSATAALLADEDANVRSWTLRALTPGDVDVLRAQLTSLARTDDHVAVRAQAAALLGSG